MGYFAKVTVSSIPPRLYTGYGLHVGNDRVRLSNETSHLLFFVYCSYLLHPIVN